MRYFKDHEVRSVVNAVRDTAVKYANTEQLRARIADIVIPLLKEGVVPDLEKAAITAAVTARSKLPSIRIVGEHIKRGTFTGINGWPLGWTIRRAYGPGKETLMSLPTDGTVWIDGVLDEPLTEQRKATMAAARSLA